MLQNVAVLMLGVPAYKACQRDVDVPHPTTWITYFCCTKDRIRFLIQNRANTKDLVVI